MLRVKEDKKPKKAKAQEDKKQKTPCKHGVYVLIKNDYKAALAFSIKPEKA